jgi:hypothetical protein
LPRGRAPVAAPRRDYCTYFDHRYLAKGLALYRSLEEHAAPFRLFVLALTGECEAALRELKLEHAVVVQLAELERSDPEFLAVKGTRNTVEYYFTSTAPLMRYLLAREKSVELLTYLDADLVFFSSPEPIYSELEGHSIGIVAHRCPERLRHLERYGIYNVGWVFFRRDKAGLLCLNDWRERCLEWCFDREQDGKFADQKYLDDWQARFAGVRVLANPGADLAPWNLAAHELASGPKGLLIDGRPLVFFHAHRCELDAAGAWEVDWFDYQVEPSALVASALLEPCAERLRRAMKDLAELVSLRSSSALAQLEAGASARSSSLLYLRTTLRTRDEELRDSREEAARLRHALAGSEADRAARLEEIHVRGARLAETEDALAAVRAELHGVEADGAARLETIRRLEGDLRTSEADRAARLAVIHRIEAELRASVADRAARLEVIQRLDRALRESEADRAERLALAERLGRELNEESALRAALAERASALEVELKDSASERSALQSTIARLEDQSDRLEAEVTAAGDRLRGLTERLNASESDRAARLAAIEALERELAAMRASLSWRLSRPLRALGAPLRRN